MTPSRAALVLFLAVEAFCIASCSPRPATGFAWTAPGANLPFRQSGRFPEGEEGAFGPGREANRYILVEPYAVQPGLALELRVQATRSIPATIRLAACTDPRGEEEAASGSFALSQGETAFVLPLPSMTLLSLSVALREDSTDESRASAPGPGGASPGGASPQGAAKIQSLAIGPSFRGYEVVQGGMRISAGFAARDQGGVRILEILSPFAGLPDGSPEQAGVGATRPALMLEYAKASAGSSFGLAAVGADGSTARFDLRARAGGSRLAFGAGLFPERTRSVTLTVPRGTELLAFGAGMADASSEELADLGRVLESPPRRPGADFDLYRWELEPRVLIADFRDYATQDRYLRRLAFFVEKAGFRGKLLADADLEGRHAYNAHDYRAEDLAAFFEAARQSSFPLSPEERGLEALLVERGLLARGGEGKLSAPASGAASGAAIISIARESAPWLRRSLLVHESAHGLFFADAEYRGFVRTAWASVGESERWFWKTYLGWAAYDTGSDYLMANEFQAYLLQLPLNRVEEYFTKQKAGELAASRPALKPAIEAYMAEFGHSFKARAAGLGAWLQSRYGPAGADAILLERRTR